jgi:hypothetical protein
MNDNCPADNSTDLANTVKEMMARLATVERQLEAETKINNELQAENIELKADKAKQEEKMTWRQNTPVLISS